ncbi:MAG: iron-containing alcohol dehydrogenase [Candidatus Protistobacter heckmanni]|nr:iron-containing alcohol dehydrogenase [Candidatus Protistobacter heckmanni]
MNFTFQSVRSIVVEAGASAKLGEIMQSLGSRTVLLVTDKGVRQAGLIDPALKSFADKGVACLIYDDVMADPPASVIEAAAAFAAQNKVDGVVGLGGGSSIDTAKLVALLAPGKEKLADIYGVGMAKGPRLPLALAPTTAGTGSEVTPISIVTTGEGEKKGVVSPVILPDCAVLDADLTLGLPAHVTAATGIDAMVHAIEAITSKRLRNPVSDCLAREALALLGHNIHIACKPGVHRAAREAMLLGAMLAGMAFANAPVAAVHALAYPVGARFLVPHGLSNALVLPHVLRFNAAAPEAEAAYSGIADILIPGASGGAASKTAALARYVASLSADLGLETRLSQVGIAERDIRRLADDAMLQTRLLVNNPREVRHEDALTIYHQAL